MKMHRLTPPLARACPEQAQSSDCSDCICVLSFHSGAAHHALLLGEFHGTEWI